jgi:hypothetical protein
MELEKIFLSEVSHVHKAKSYMFSLILWDTGHAKGRSYVREGG